MRSSILGAVFAIVFAAEARAFVGTSLTGLNRAAFQRETSDICQASCSSFDDATCADLDCLCTPSNTAALQQCITCYTTNDPSQATTDAAQNLVDKFDEACYTYPLPTVTLPSTSDPTGGSASPPSATTRGNTLSATSVRPVSSPGPTPVQQTQTANFPAASSANTPNGPQLGGHALPNSLANGVIMGICAVVVGLVLAV